MSTIIEEITPEQEARIPEYVKKGVDIGLSTDQAPDEDIIKAVQDIARVLLEMNPVPPVLVTDSPMHAWHVVCLLEEGAELDGVVEEGARRLAEGIKPSIGFVWPHLDGAYSANVYVYYDYMFEVLGVENPCQEEYGIWKRGCIAGPLYPVDRAVVVSRKPVEIHLSPEGEEPRRLHNPKGMAVKFRDGWGLYNLNGVRVPGWLVMTPEEELQPEQFAEISNVEVRREFVRKFGIERLAYALGAETIDKHGDYELLLVDLKGQTGKWPYLKMRNPSLEDVWHLECVDRSCRTVKEALAFRNQTDVEPSQLT